MSGPDQSEISVLIGGKAGDGINSAGLTIAQLLNHLGYQVYMYFDYPSLIKGGHNYAVIRGSAEKVGAHRHSCDFLLALNQDAIGLHAGYLTGQTVVIYDSSLVKADGVGIAVAALLKEENAPVIMGNSVITGAFARSAGIEWQVVEAVLKKQIPKAIEQNLRVARRGYDTSMERRKIQPVSEQKRPILTGNEAIGLGLFRAGLEAYVAYPMTPTSNLLHFLAEHSETIPVTVVHPENEIAVILMALGFAYAGKRSAVGTSGGGFCLMTEGFSLAGMSETPVVVVMGQRTGPSTGLPTYTGQSDLHFMMHAGQGEFPRFIVAPGNLEQAYGWSSAALDIAWKYQVPAIILVDKTLCEGTYTFDEGMARVPAIPLLSISRDEIPYRRYALTGSGISPMQFPPAEGAVVKVNSYAHDESGISTEKAEMVKVMAEKRIRKGELLRAEIEGLECVNIEGDPESGTALLCWGSNLGVCTEVAAHLGLKVVQPVVLCPFPEASFGAATEGVRTLIAVEDNTGGQLSMLLSGYGIRTHRQLLRYDGRPFPVDELEQKVREVL